MPLTPFDETAELMTERLGGNMASGDAAPMTVLPSFLTEKSVVVAVPAEDDAMVKRTLFAEFVVEVARMENIADGEVVPRPSREFAKSKLRPSVPAKEPALLNWIEPVEPPGVEPPPVEVAYAPHAPFWYDQT
jgi:hypothetical protein